MPGKVEVPEQLTEQQVKDLLEKINKTDEQIKQDVEKGK